MMEKTKLFGLIVVKVQRSSQVVGYDGYLLNVEPLNKEMLLEIFRKFIIHNYNRIPIPSPTQFIHSVRYFSARELNSTLTNGRTILARNLIYPTDQPRVFNTNDFNTTRTYVIPRKLTN